jgi:putative SOS response-associated peptidase YedK
VVTIEANGDVAPYQDRQMAVLRRLQRMEWLDLSRSEHELLQPSPIGTFRVERAIARQAQTALAL